MVYDLLFPGRLFLARADVTLLPKSTRSKEKYKNALPNDTKPMPDDVEHHFAQFPAQNRDIRRTRASSLLFGKRFNGYLVANLFPATIEMP